MILEPSGGSGSLFPPGRIDVCQVKFAALSVSCLTQRHLAAQTSGMPGIERITHRLFMLINRRQSMLIDQSLDQTVDGFVCWQRNGRGLPGAKVECVPLLWLL